MFTVMQTGYCLRISGNIKTSHLTVAKKYTIWMCNRYHSDITEQLLISKFS